MAWSEWLFLSNFDTYGIMKPSKLHFQSYAFMGRSYGLILKNDNLYAYSSFMLGSSEFPRYLDEIIESGMLQRFGDLIVAEAPQPTQDMWEKFYQILCDVKVKEWEKEYSDIGIIDGGGWEFKIRFKDIYRTTGGMNAYPKKMMVNGKKVDPYDMLYAAIDDLTSGVFKETRDKSYGY